MSLQLNLPIHLLFESWSNAPLSAWRYVMQPWGLLTSVSDSTVTPTHGPPPDRGHGLSERSQTRQLFLAVKVDFFLGKGEK